MPSKSLLQLWANLLVWGVSSLDFPESRCAGIYTVYMVAIFSRERESDKVKQIEIGNCDLFVSNLGPSSNGLWSAEPLSREIGLIVTDIELRGACRV